MNVQDMKTSLACQNQNGITVQPSGQDVAQASTQLDEKNLNKQTLLCLCSIVNSLLYETLSEDAVFLALLRAEKECFKNGISPKVWEETKKIILTHWETQRNKNPLSRMF